MGTLARLVAVGLMGALLWVPARAASQSPTGASSATGTSAAVPGRAPATTTGTAGSGATGAATPPPQTGPAPTFPAAGTAPPATGPAAPSAPGGPPALTPPGATGASPAAIVLAQAIAVGSIGSAAFLIGVWLGFITPTSRPQIMLYMLSLIKPGPRPAQGSTESRADYEERLADWNAGTLESIRWGRVVLFTLFGGLVAAVFQWADPTRFIPIQAFVLGATWPSVVTRVMAGGSADPAGPGPGGTRPVSPVPNGSSGGSSGGGGGSTTTTTTAPPKGEILVGGDKTKAGTNNAGGATP